MFNQKEFNDFVLEKKIIGIFQNPIKLKSGRISNWYVNWRNAGEDVFLTDKLTDFIIEFVKEKNLEVDTFYGVPEGATKTAIITQYKWAKNSQKYKEGSHRLSMGRGKPKEHGAIKDRCFLGIPKEKTIILEDVTTTGESLIKCIKLLRNASINVVAAIGLTNRNEIRNDGKTVKEAVEKLGVKYYALSNAYELLPLFLKRNKVDKIEIKRLKEYFIKYSNVKLNLEGGENE